MKIEKDKCEKCGKELVGTVDLIPGRANVSRQDDGTYEYSGETEVFWDGQYTLTNRETDNRAKKEDLKYLVECRNGHQWYTGIDFQTGEDAVSTKAQEVSG